MIDKEEVYIFGDEEPVRIIEIDPPEYDYFELGKPEDMKLKFI